MTSTPDTSTPEVGPASTFHGSRLAGLTDTPVVLYDREHPDGRPVRPPEDGSLEILRCQRCNAEFYRLTGSRPNVCRQCAAEVQHAASTRAAAPWLEAIGADGLGLSTDIVGTGGGCEAIAVDLGAGGPAPHSYTGGRFYALVTHAEDASVPEAGDPAAVGIYDALEDDGCGYPEDDGPRFLVTDSPEAVADFCFLWADRLNRLETASADDLTAWGIDPGRRSGFGAV